MGDDAITSKGLLTLAVAGWSVFVLGLAYLLTTVVGLFTIKSPGDPIGQPYFIIMESLILLIAPLMAIGMAGIHYYGGARNKVWGLAATGCMFIMAAITSCVHFVILFLGNNISDKYQRMFSFRWPSVVYVLDIVAWDWFFPLAMFFAAPLYSGGRLENTIRGLMITAGLLSLTGLLGMPTGNMQLRNIGIIGYGALGPIIFLLIGILSMKKPNQLKLPLYN